MADISIDDIKKLRQMTGAGLTDAKKTLQENNGDFDKALADMRRKGLTKADKRSEREARSGLIGSYNHDGRIGVLVEVNCETDFVAKTDEFKELVKDLCMHVAASNPDDIKQLLQQEFVKKPEQAVAEYIKEYIAKLGENIVIRRFSRLELGETE
jgi:elongation factor Ts